MPAPPVLAAVTAAVVPFLVRARRSRWALALAVYSVSKWSIAGGLGVWLAAHGRPGWFLAAPWWGQALVTGACLFAAPGAVAGAAALAYRRRPDPAVDPAAGVPPLG